MISRFNQRLLDFTIDQIDQSRKLAVERGQSMGLIPIHDPIPLYGVSYSRDVEFTVQNLKPKGLSFLVLNNRCLPTSLIRTYISDQGVVTGGVEGFRKSLSGLIYRIINNMDANHTLCEIQIPWLHVVMFRCIETNQFINWDGTLMDLDQAQTLIQNARKEWLASH